MFFITNNSKNHLTFSASVSSFMAVCHPNNFSRNKIMLSGFPKQLYLLFKGKVG